MSILYPMIKPYTTHELPVDSPHVLYIEETGNPNGVPVLVLHGGPGLGSDPYFRRFFDPNFYRIILFDQRGCGRSTPYLELTLNSTDKLLNDIDAIKSFLKLDKMVLFGDGWGALLALLYAEIHPDSVSHLLLFRTSLGRAQDIDWLYKEGANAIYPDAWQDFVRAMQQEGIEKPINYYYDCINGRNELMGMASARQWALWRQRCSSLHTNVSVTENPLDSHAAMSLVTLETHYLLNHFFIKENQVMNHMDNIKSIPTYFVHGRYDMISPLQGVWLLHLLHPLSRLSIVREAGHSEYELGISDALLMATAEIAAQNMDAS